MDLKQVHEGVHRHKGRKRLGRGPGSGHGKTSSRGMKGQKSRSGGEPPHLLYEGGQMKMARRVPKRGFTNRWADRVLVVNVRDLDQRFADGDTVDVAALRRAGLANGLFDKVKVLGDGQIAKKLTVVAHQFSRSAAEKIAAAGGSAQTIAAST
jgi:large subunit ribosomal protein L15